MWLMLQQDKPDDFVIATGQKHTVREFARLAFQRVNLDWEKHVVVDPQFYRPADVNTLCGDPAKARQHLGWQPKVSFEQLVHLMVDEDMARVRAELQYHQAKR